MLKHLNINDFAIVPTLDLEIRSGFTAITGETGAGKSILVDALGLLLGERSDAAWVRAGAKRAELTAEFSVANNQQAQQWLDQADLSDDGSCLLRRTIGANGRSRAFINGSPVTVAQMQSLGNLLVEIHGQNEHLKLTRSAEQFRLLDGSGDYHEELAMVRTAHADWQLATTELEKFDRESSVSASDLDFLKFQLAELQQHDLAPESIISLQTDHDRLAAGGELLEALSGSIEQLEPESTAGHAGINSKLNTVLIQLEPFVSLDNDIGEACQMLQEAAVNCSEALNSLRSARERIDLAPGKLEDVAARLGQLHDMSRKHKVAMEGLGQLAESISARIEDAENFSQRRAGLEAKLNTHLDGYRDAAEQLHQRRERHASELSARVADLMAELGMPGGSFDLSVTLNGKATPCSRGDDSLEIRISANPGLPPGPLGKIASGGELSRISLAIKVASASGGDSVTQIFDEVDVGIGGDTANAVGRLVRRLAADRQAGNGQALCVTHLAQVAVCAAHQIQVRKDPDNGAAMVGTHLLDNDERIDEVARMLSGNISRQSRAHAAELLAAANIPDRT
jgi:DNA repair protein RecN (Recombination protein N)